jgi:MOSC domain-containing protein YiiM
MSDRTGTGRLEAIWVKRARRGPMDARERVTIDGSGLVGNANRGGRRPVTVFEREVFTRLQADLDPAVRPEMRRANLMISGLSLEGTRGRVLEIGGCRIRVGGETRPCETMDERGFPGLRAALDTHWGGGIYGMVLRPAEVAVGDPVRWVDESDSPSSLGE